MKHTRKTIAAAVSNYWFVCGSVWVWGVFQIIENIADNILNEIFSAGSLYQKKIRRLLAFEHHS